MENTQKTSTSRMLNSMVGIGVSCALIIVVTYQYTLPVIQKNKALALEKAVYKVLPDIKEIKAFDLNANDEFMVSPPSDKAKNLVYAGYAADGKLNGIALSAKGQGYSEGLNILYGYDPFNEKIIGFYVLESKETPGLGDRIEKDTNFLSNFKALDVQLSEDGQSLKNNIETVKKGSKQHDWQIDGITGATISSRAVGNILRESTATILPKVHRNKEKFEKLN